MVRSLLGIVLGVVLCLSASSARADEIKRSLYVLGVHMQGAEGVAIGQIGEDPKLKPGAMALMKRQLNDSIDVATVLKLPTMGLKSLLADLDKASFADMAGRMAKMREEMAVAASKSINPGAGAFFIMGVHLSGAEHVALGAGTSPRADKPGTSALIERQLVRMADGAGGIMVTLKPVLEIQDNLGKGATFPDLALQLGKLRLAWEKELAAQPGFPAVVAGGGGKVLFSAAAKLTNADPKDPARKSSFHKVHIVALKAGETVIIDLESGAGDPIPKEGFFDTYLRLEDAANKELGRNDDISSLNYNSRLEFTPTQDGNYRIVVNSFRDGATGAYTLTVRQK